MISDIYFWKMKGPVEWISGLLVFLSFVLNQYLEMVLFAFGITMAYLVAAPAAWLIIRRWLQDFAYRTSLSWWIFALAGLVTFVISVLTITLQIYRVARQNPVRVLRYE